MHTFNASMDSPPTPPQTFPHQKTTSLHKGEKAAWEWITEWFCSKYGTLCTAWILEIKPESPSFGKNCTAERFILLAKWEMIHMLEFHHLDVMKSLPPCLPQAPDIPVLGKPFCSITMSIVPTGDVSWCHCCCSHCSTSVSLGIKAKQEQKALR